MVVDGIRQFSEPVQPGPFAVRTLPVVTGAGEVAVGEHPNAMLQSLDGKLLFVACANTNAVWVVDVATRRAVAWSRNSIRGETN